MSPCTGAAGNDPAASSGEEEEELKHEVWADVLCFPGVLFSEGKVKQFWGVCAQGQSVVVWGGNPCSQEKPLPDFSPLEKKWALEPTK